MLKSILIGMSLVVELPIIFRMAALTVRTTQRLKNLKGDVTHQNDETHIRFANPGRVVIPGQLFGRTEFPRGRPARRSQCRCFAGRGASLLFNLLIGKRHLVVGFGVKSPYLNSSCKSHASITSGKAKSRGSRGFLLFSTRARPCVPGVDPRVSQRNSSVLIPSHTIAPDIEASAVCCGRHRQNRDARC